MIGTFKPGQVWENKAKGLFAVVFTSEEWGVTRRGGFGPKVRVLVFPGKGRPYQRRTWQHGPPRGWTLASQI